MPTPPMPHRTARLYDAVGSTVGKFLADEYGRKAMEEMIVGYKANPEPAREAARMEAADKTQKSDALPLNEVGIMATMETRRQELGK